MLLSICNYNKREIILVGNIKLRVKHVCRKMLSSNNRWTFAWEVIISSEVLHSFMVLNSTIILVFPFSLITAFAVCNKPIVNVAVVVVVTVCVETNT